MRMLAKSFGVVVVAGEVSNLFGCAGITDNGVQSAGFSVQRLEIATVVSTSFPYEATMYCRGLETVRILMGYFWWNDEGPFRYGVKEMDLKKGKQCSG